MSQGERLSDLTPEAQRELLRNFIARRKTAEPEGSPPLPGTGATAGAPTPANAEVSASFYDFSLFPEYQQLHLFQSVAERGDINNPYFKMHQGIAAATTVVNNRELINFSSYNYLGLNGHRRIVDAAKAALDRFGVSASASRLVAGERPPHRDLERALADLHGVEDAIAYVSGHATNVSTISCLFGPRDLVMHDRLAHNSIIQGTQLSGAARQAFDHNDWRAVDAFLDDNRHRFEKVLIAVEGLYSMDGDLCPLPEFVEVKRKHKALLMVDEAHSIGVLGRSGRGVGEHFGLPGDAVDIWMGTLSKTLSACGGYIAGCRALVELLKFRAPGFVYSVGMPPAVAAAARESIRIMLEEPDRVARLRRNSQLFVEAAKAKGLDTGRSEGYAVAAVVTRSSLAAVRLSNRLLEQGVNALPIIYPAVEEQAARLRFFLTSQHSPEQIRSAVTTTAEQWALLQQEA
jgi:8-amino-7-oxononanoate synthase